MRPVRFNIITLGCAKNICDSERLMGYLSKGTAKIVHEQPLEKDDIVIVNTCGFINDAKQESIDYIMEMAEAKKAGKLKELIVVGCLSQRYLQELKKEIPEADAFFGVNFIPEVLKKYNIDYRSDLIENRILTTPSHYAYLKISDGCDRLCSFCAIPLIKGRHKSVPMEELLAEAENLVANGVKELILIAQDTTYYGKDIYGKRKLAELLNKLSFLKNLEWIRLQYTYPAGFPSDVLDIINEKPYICKYIDIPFQHISDKMLRIMRRKISKEKTIKLVEEIRKKIPGVTLRTTFIVGHPGETDKDFDELMEFVRLTRFERMGVFTYSHEENTHSFKLKDNIPRLVKEERAGSIMETQRKISSEINRSKTGSVLKVIIDRQENDYYVGRTESDSPEVDNEVIVQNKSLKIGEFYQVKISEAFEYDIMGEVINF